VPDKVKKLDIDLVIIFSPAEDYPAFYYYYLYNLTPEGIPQAPPDPEYVLKPALERIPDGLPRKFYEYCKAHNWVWTNGKNLHFDEQQIMTDPKSRDMLLELWGKPWDTLNRKLSNMRTSSGKPVKLLILFGYGGTISPETYKPEMYKEVARKYNIPFFDLNPYLNALDLSYFPMTGMGHFDPNGAIFMGKLLSRVLPDENLIPWPAPEKALSK
jgi:hypothetical protein